jgi:hypothetical protein
MPGQRTILANRAVPVQGDNTYDGHSCPIFLISSCSPVSLIIQDETSTRFPVKRSNKLKTARSDGLS